jgi:hypothetical protein
MTRRYRSGDLVWIWRGARPGSTKRAARVLGDPFTLGGTLGVRVRWIAPHGGENTDFIALTHVAPRDENGPSQQPHGGDGDV